MGGLRMAVGRRPPLGGARPAPAPPCPPAGLGGGWARPRSSRITPTWLLHHGADLLEHRAAQHAAQEGVGYVEAEEEDQDAAVQVTQRQVAQLRLRQGGPGQTHTSQARARAARAWQRPRLGWKPCQGLAAPMTKGTQPAHCTCHQADGQRQGSGATRCRHARALPCLG